MSRRLLGRQVLHGAHDLTGRGQRNLVGDARDAEVGDLHAAVRRDQQVAGLDVAVHEARGVGRLQRRGGLRDVVEDGVGRQRVVALEARRQRLTGHELHHEVCRAVLLAVVEDARDALMVHEGRVPGLGAEALEEARIPHVFVFEDLDRDGAADDVVGGFPHLAHSADRDARTQLVASAERHTLGWPHCASTASMTFFAMGAAIEFPSPD
jgi:hypothetical protein